MAQFSFKRMYFENHLENLFKVICDFRFSSKSRGLTIIVQPIWAGHNLCRWRWTKLWLGTALQLEGAWNGAKIYEIIIMARSHSCLGHNHSHSLDQQWGHTHDGMTIHKISKITNTTTLINDAIWVCRGPMNNDKDCQVGQLTQMMAWPSTRSARSPRSSSWRGRLHRLAPLTTNGHCRGCEVIS